MSKYTKFYWFSLLFARFIKLFCDYFYILWLDLMGLNAIEVICLASNSLSSECTFYVICHAFI